jgi:hypothetical protein
MAAKKKVKRVSKKLDGAFGEPKWDDLQFTADQLLDLDDGVRTEINLRITQGLNFYNYHNTSKDSKQPLIEWMKSQKIVDKTAIAAIKGAPDYQIGITAGSVARMLLKGAPPMDNLVHSLKKRIKEIVESIDNPQVWGEGSLNDTPKTQEKPKTAQVISIQDRMIEKTNAFVGEYVESAIDDMIASGFKSDFKLSTLLQTHGISGKAAGLIPKMFETEIADLTAIVNGVDKEDDYEAQLLEGYPYTKAEIKKLLAFYTAIVADAEHHGNLQKATRKVRKKKAPSKEKLVTKIKYKLQDEKLKLVSIDPKDILGANELWVYNTKNRKLGKYVASNIDPKGMAREGTGLSIKGTTIIGFDEKLSIQKTLRKPEDSLKEFKSAGKVALRKFMDELTTTDTKLNGRVNSDTILLKVI